MVAEGRGGGRGPASRDGAGASQFGAPRLTRLVSAVRACLLPCLCVSPAAACFAAGRSVSPALLHSSVTTLATEQSVTRRASPLLVVVAAQPEPAGGHRSIELLAWPGGGSSQTPAPQPCANEGPKAAS